MACCRTCSADGCRDARRAALARADSDEMDAPSVVIAGLDPAIHLLRKDSIRNRWTPGSSPGVTNVGLRGLKSIRSKLALEPQCASGSLFPVFEQEVLHFAERIAR